jgi:regulator of RNase E activity RraB
MLKNTSYLIALNAGSREIDRRLLKSAGVTKFIETYGVFNGSSELSYNVQVCDIPDMQEFKALLRDTKQATIMYLDNNMNVYFEKFPTYYRDLFTNPSGQLFKVKFKDIGNADYTRCCKDNSYWVMQ